MKADDHLDIERLGGLAGIGLPGSPIRSRAHLKGTDLNAAERTCVAALFATPPAAPVSLGATADAFRYRLTLHQMGSSRQLEVGEAQLLASLRDRVQDELI